MLKYVNTRIEPHQLRNRGRVVCHLICDIGCGGGKGWEIYDDAPFLGMGAKPQTGARSAVPVRRIG
jgi:hypothetical protein